MFWRFTVALFFLLFSIPANSESPLLLDARQTSGFTRMEDAFENTCKLDSSGHLHGLLKQGRTDSGGWRTQKKIEFTLNSTETKEILSLLKASQSGPFREEPAICDTGDLLIRASSGKGSFPVIEIHDCEKGITNTSPAAKQVEEWVRHHCFWAS